MMTDIMCSPAECDIAEVRTQIERLASLMAESKYFLVYSRNYC